MLKKIFGASVPLLLCLTCMDSYCDITKSSAVLKDNQEKGNKSKDNDEENINSQSNDEISWNIRKSFLNLKFMHERSGDHAFGPKNTSAVGFNPVIRLWRFTLDADFFYGWLNTYSGYCKDPRYVSRIASDLPFFFKNFPQMRKPINNAMSNELTKAHFYRNYARCIYNDEANNFIIVAGDTAVKSTIGFQQTLSGAGISIYRQAGNGSEINNSSPIVITRLSKLECKLGDQILCVKILPPGLYTINDFPEEARIPGISLKISDQLSRSEKLKVDYFGGYSMLDEGADDFDIALVFDHKWNVETPHSTKYHGKPRFSSNYRYGYTKDMTAGIGLQAAKNHALLDFLTIVETEYGKISPNLAFSSCKDYKGTFGAGIYYAIPTNDLGMHLELFAAVKEKGFSDLGKTQEQEDVYNAFINKYFASTPNIVNKLLNSSVASSSRQVTVRLFSDAIAGFIPSFIFNGEWASSQRLREYTVSLSTKRGPLCVVLSAGLTYDDPSKGANQQSPDRRLTLACCWNINSEFSVKGTYSYYEAEKRKLYGCITYTPDAIKGLEINAENTSRPGKSSPVFSVKYDGQYFNAKYTKCVINTYQDTGANTVNSHMNLDSFVAGTSITADGLRAHKNNSFNVIRCR